MAINKKWHLAHPMPPHATMDERIQWHIQHLKHCDCRKDLPVRIREEMKKRNISLT